MTQRQMAVMGGKARAAKMTPEQRIESARKAVMARWAKRRRYVPQKEQANA